MVPFKYVPNVYKANNTHPHMGLDGFSNITSTNQTASHLSKSRVRSKTYWAAIHKNKSSN